MQFFGKPRRGSPRLASYMYYSYAYDDSFVKFESSVSPKGCPKSVLMQHEQLQQPAQGQQQAELQQDEQVCSRQSLTVTDMVVVKAQNNLEACCSARRTDIGLGSRIP